MSSSWQSALPLDETADLGPKHRGGGGTLTISILGLLVAVLIPIGVFANRPVSGGVWPAIVFAAAFGLLSAWGLWCVIEAAGGRGALPECRYLLRDDLKFIIPRPASDVSLTAFFRPDKVGTDGATCLLVFLENHASRQRRVTLHLPAKPGFGLRQSRQIHLALAPGQAAAYRLPLRVDFEHSPIGEVDLTIRVVVKMVTGPGLLLPAPSGKKGLRQASFTLSSRLFLRPFLVVATGGESAVSGHLAADSYLALSGLGQAEPRFDLLGKISESLPTQEVGPETAPAAEAG
jgi:hypothetical protein